MYLIENEKEGWDALMGIGWVGIGVWSVWRLFIIIILIKSF